MIIKQEKEELTVLCVCGHTYLSTPTEHSVDKYGDLYPQCPICLKTEGFSHASNGQLATV